MTPFGDSRKRIINDTGRRHLAAPFLDFLVPGFREYSGIDMHR